MEETKLDKQDCTREKTEPNTKIEIHNILQNSY